MINECEVICLIKPQFEAGKGKVGKKGVVRDPEVHKEVLDDFIINAEKSGFFINDITYSPVKGPKGNIEFLAHLDTTAKPENTKKPLNTSSIISESHTKLNL